MKDGIIKENGASRLVKGTLPATYEEFAALAASAGVPVDVFFNAAGWQQLPTFLNKANLLQDFTATLLGLDPADDPTVDDAFLNVFLTSANAGLLKIQVYETGTTTPISGVHITGATDLLGGELYADANGLAVGMATSETSTLQVDAAYIDLTGQTVFSGATPAQQITEITLYATRVSNPSGKIETFTASTQKMFTNAVGRVDVHSLGGGKGGSRGSASYSSQIMDVAGGHGGKGGGNSYKLNVLFSPNQLFSITVGAGGRGASSATQVNNNAISSIAGVNGGNSECLGVTASGGTGYVYGGEVRIDNSGDDIKSSESDAQTPSTVSAYIFGNSENGISGGGDGGAGGAAAVLILTRLVNSTNGADPYGGNAGRTEQYDWYNGSNGRGPGGGGGGGSSYSLSSERGTGGGGDGQNGRVWIRWFYT